jgi:hypothetical protein
MLDQKETEEINLEEEEKIAKANGKVHSDYYYLDLAIRTK